MSDRFKPTRAGVINVWDYVDEEWIFADGRLALRGHNGSGKTKALEVLFPFVLDGVADSRRLDPFSGENRTMKSNLLYRGQESEYGYVWMEFTRPGATVTLIIGMRAHRNTDGVRVSFYVTGKRLGADFGLLSADSRPLTERQLRAVLEPDAWRKTATEYRDLVDTRLFGLGRERYAQLLDLLLALRRPLLAKDLDPAKVSDTLTSGLSPVDEYLVQQAARDFENLAAVQKLFDDLTAANAAVQDFLGHYTVYLRAHAKFQLDRVQARADAAAGHAETIIAAVATYRGAVEAERHAETERNARRDEGETLQGRLAGLKNSEEYKAQGRIEDKRREMLAGAREVAGQRNRLGQDRRELGEAEGAARKLTRRAAAARNDADRYARELADAAQRSGVADDGFGPVDSGDDLLLVARARVAARRDDVGEIRRLLQAIRDANGKRGLREQDLGDQQTAEQAQEQAAAAAAARLATARQTAADELAAWTGRWSGPAGAPSGTSAPPPGPIVAAPDAEALAEALDLIGEPGATSITEVFDGRTAERQAVAITARAHLQTDRREIRARLAGLRAERDTIAAEQDDAPPANDLRPARREGRPGAPLWRLVRFADGIDDAEAAAIEGALYGAGLLTAWVHPDPALTEAALAAAEADGYLIPSAPVNGRTLADVLVPEEQDRVAPAVVTALLGSVALTDDIVGTADLEVPAVSTKAQFTYGVHAGARPKAAPEYIGATNRASRRRVRLAEYDELVEATIAEEERLAGELNRASALLEDFRRARRELPDTRPVAKAAEVVGTHAVLLARARDETAAARTALDAAIAEVDAMTRRLRQAAAERRMPTADDQVDAIARAAAEFENAATQLHAERAKLAQAEEDLAAQTETIERRKLDLRPGRRGTRRAGAAAARPGRGVPDAGRDPAGGRPAGPGADPADRNAHQRCRTGLPRSRRAGPRRARPGYSRRGGTTQPAAVARRSGRAVFRAGRTVRRVRPARPSPARRGHGRRAVARTGPLARPGPCQRGPGRLADQCRPACPGPGRGRPRGAAPGRCRDPRRVRRRDPRRATGHRGHAEEHRGPDVGGAEGFHRGAGRLRRGLQGRLGPRCRGHRARDRRRGPQAGRPVRHPDRRTRRRPGRPPGGPGTQGTRGRIARRARPADLRPGARRTGPNPRHELRHQVQADVVRNRGRHPLGPVRQDHRAAAGHVPAAGTRLARPGAGRRTARPAPRDDPGVPGEPLRGLPTGKRWPTCWTTGPGTRSSCCSSGPASRRCG